jgi:VanZ family protein
MQARHFFPAFAWLVFVTVLSTMPGVQLPRFNLIGTDKLAHAFVYGVLVWLILRGVARAGMRISLWMGLAAFACSAGYGAFMEWVQGTFFPGRFFEWDDMIANTFGAAVGWLVSRWTIAATN